jgi:arylsulfatase
MSVDGARVAEGRIARTQPFAFSADEGADVGEDLATPVSEEYRVPATFTGTIHSVTIEVQPIAAADRSAVDQSAIEGLEKRADFD